MSIDGNSRAYALQRLKSDFPALYERVLDGELTANAAAIEAGFRRKPTPLDRLLHSWNRASPADRNQFLTVALSKTIGRGGSPSS